MPYSKHYIIETLSDFDTEQEHENEQCNYLTGRPSKDPTHSRGNASRNNIDA